MTLQHWIMLLLTTAAAAYMARKMFKSSCGSGCGSCKNGCPAKKLEAIRAKLEDSHSGL
jgi:Pyruvate/2-oxoacid:ferredoxin oxidoreductase delta subunit